MSIVKQNLLSIKKQISEYEKKYQRIPGSVRLLAVSKKQPIEKMIEAYDLGQRAFGENYIQEALKKMVTFTNQKKAIEWHFIGSIQSNKTRKIAEHFAWVHSVDQAKIAKRLNDQRGETLTPLNICIEVNVSHELTKTGTSFAGVLKLVDYCLTLPRLKLRGLMCIPALQADFDEQRRAFHRLFLLWQTLREQKIPVDTLSMGTSEDFEAAIAEGATLIRIGTAIFGQREM